MSTILRTLHREAELQRRHFRYYNKLRSSRPVRIINAICYVAALPFRAMTVEKLRKEGVVR